MSVLSEEGSCQINDYLYFQENEKSPSQNRKAKDASSDNIKGKYLIL